jgi:hypothetical protein
VLAHTSQAHISPGVNVVDIILPFSVHSSLS